MDPLRRLPVHKLKYITRHPPLLDFLGALGDPVAAVMPVNMLKRRVPRVTQSAMHLHRLVRCISAQPVGDEVAHGHCVRFDREPITGGRKRERGQPRRIALPAITDVAGAVID